MVRSKNIVVNIPSDGLEEEIVRRTDAEPGWYRDRIEHYVNEFLEETPCGRMFYNVCYKRSVVHSEVMDTYLYNISRDAEGNPLRDENGQVIKDLIPPADSPLNRGYYAMLSRNIDIIQMAVEATSKQDAEAWLSVRMNDHHYPDDPCFNSSLGYDRAETMGINGSRVYLDYLKKPVQHLYKSYIEELCRNYDVCGIELDFLRSCPVMSVVSDETVSALSSYVKEIRQLLNRIGAELSKPFQFAVRVYPTIEMNLAYGLDVAGWVAEGSVDLITLENWYIPTWYNIPVETFRNAVTSRNAEKHPYTLLCGTDWGVSCDETPGKGKELWLSLEQMKGFVSSAYGRGADGIYLFNHFNTDDDCHTYKNLGLYTYYIDETGKVLKQRVLKEKIRASVSAQVAEQGMRTYVNTYPDGENPYPITLLKEKGFSFMPYTGTKPQSGYYHLVVGVDTPATNQPLSVTVNGRKATQIQDVPKAAAFVSMSGNKASTFVNHVSETAQRVMRFKASLDAVCDGFNNIEIRSREEKVIIRWLEIQVESQ